MDDNVTAISSSNDMSAVGGDNINTHGTYRELFSKVFPSYLAIGMTYDEFYNKDHTLAADYRKAFKIKRNEANFDMWLQGLYVYNAVARVAPLMIPFNKNPKAEPYLDKPIPIFEETSEEETKAKAVQDKGKAYMLAVMSSINKKFGEG